ncbi:MAG: copper-binding protein [Bryobacteraceae bacterium]|nr:copper-binding protein [Bryobacteraceae bacterium]
MKFSLAVGLVAALLLAACGNKEPEAAGPVNEYQMRGVVVRLFPERKVAVVKHEKIEGWMEAMTMEFPVKDAAEFAKLREGATIRARVKHRPSDFEYWLERIEVE